MEWHSRCPEQPATGTSARPICQGKISQRSGDIVCGLLTLVHGAPAAVSFIRSPAMSSGRSVDSADDSDSSQAAVNSASTACQVRGNKCGAGVAFPHCLLRMPPPIVPCSLHMRVRERAAAWAHSAHWSSLTAFCDLV